jgi:hypothetical protein
MVNIFDTTLSLEGGVFVISGGGEVAVVV